MLTALAALFCWQVAVLVAPAVVLIAWCLISEAQTRKAWRIAEARAEENRRTLAYFASLPESFDDHPARRADHAKTRTAMTHRRMIEDAWKKATGGDAA